MTDLPPKWEREIEGYTRRFCRSNAWRTDATVGEEDLLQEAWVVFRRCALLYADQVENMAHFMALYKTALRNRIYQLAAAGQARTEQREEVPSLAEAATDKGMGDPARAVGFKIALQEAPPILRPILDRAYAESTITSFFQQRWRGRRETTARMLCRIAGVRYTPEIRKALERWKRDSLQEGRIG